MLNLPSASPKRAIAIEMRTDSIGGFQPCNYTTQNSIASKGRMRSGKQKVERFRKKAVSSQNQTLDSDTKVCKMTSHYHY